MVPLHRLLGTRPRPVADAVAERAHTEPRPEVPARLSSPAATSSVVISRAPDHHVLQKARSEGGETGGRAAPEPRTRPSPAAPPPYPLRARSAVARATLFGVMPRKPASFPDTRQLLGPREVAARDDVRESVAGGLESEHQQATRL